MNGAYPKLVDIIGASKNDVILFVTILCIAVYVAGRPLYQTIVEAQQKKRKQYFEREQLLIRVITDNSAVIAKLTNLLESTNQNCHECRETQTALIRGVSARQDEIWGLLTQQQLDLKLKHRKEAAVEEIA